MSKTWSLTRLAEVLTPVARAEAPSPGKVYRQIGVKLWGKGAYEREPIDGSQTKYARLLRAAADDIIVNKIWARNGSVAVVPTSLDGCFGSGEFPMFAADKERLEPRWMHWLTKTPGFWAQCDLKSQGTSGKNRIRAEQFLGVEIPLPPLAEQQRVVARIEELAGHIQEARDLRQQSNDLGDVLGRSILFHDREAVPTPLNELVRLRLPDVTVRRDEVYQFAGVYCFGRGAFRGSKKSGTDFSYPRLTRLKTGNFLYPKLMAWEGALSVVPHECDGCVVSTEFPVFEVLEEKVLPEVLDTYFKTPSVWPTLAGASTGTNVRRRRLNPKDFLTHKMPLPSKPSQQRLRHVAQELSSTRRLQSATAAEIDALLPAILDRAFKGELL